MMHKTDKIKKLFLTIFMVTGILLFNFSAEAKSKKNRNRYQSLNFVSGLNPDLELSMNLKSYNLDLSRTQNLRVRIKERELYNSIDRTDSYRIDLYEIVNNERKFVSTQNLTLFKGSRRSRIISIAAGYFAEPDKSIEFDVYNTNNTLINTYSTEISAFNLDSQVVSTISEFANADCDSDNFGDCQMDYLFRRIKIEAKPQRQVSTRVIKGEDGYYKITVPVPRSRFRFLGRRVRRKAKDNGGGGSGSFTSAFGETLAGSELQLGFSALDHFKILEDANSGNFELGYLSNSPRALYVDQNNNAGFGIENPEGRVHIHSDGTNAPLILEAGDLISPVVNGAFEFDGDKLYFTKNGSREELGAQGPAGATGPQGPTGATGPAGPAGPAGTVNGMISNATLNGTTYINSQMIFTGNGSIEGNVTVNGTVIADQFNGTFIGDGSGLTGIAGSNGTVNNFTINNGDIFNSFINNGSFANGNIYSTTINNNTITNNNITNNTLNDNTLNGTLTFNSNGKLQNAYFNGNTIVNGPISFTGNGMLQDPTLNGTSTVSGNINVSGSINGTTLDLDFSNGSVIFSDQNGILREDNNNFFWDRQNNRLGVGRNDPNELLTVNGSISMLNLSSAPAATAGFGKLFSNGNILYYRNGNGAITNLLAGMPNADTLDTLDSTDFLRSNASDSYTGANTLTIAAAATLDIDGTLDIDSTAVSIADTNITLDGASTTFTQTTGDIGLSPGNGGDLKITLLGPGDLEVDVNKFVIENNGNVGIGVGTGSIDAKLEVNGTILANLFNGNFIGNGRELTGVAMNNGGSVVNQTINNSTVNNADIYNSTLHNTTVNGLVTFTGNGMLQDSTLNGTTTVSGNINVSGSINGTTLDLDFSNGSVVFSDQNGVLNQDNNNFFWDRQNTRLGIGRNDPNELLTVNGTISMLNLSSAPAATAGFGKLFSNGNILYYRNGNGAITNLLAGMPNADTLDTLDSTDFLRSNASDSYTGANTLTIAAAATLDIDGTLDIDSTAVSIADTDITLDGASTAFTQTTGDISFNPGNGGDLKVTLLGPGDLEVDVNKFVIENNGNVGIGVGTGSIDAKLEVNGTILANLFNGNFIGNGRELTGVAMDNGDTVVNQTINNSTVNNADIYNSTLHNTTVNGLVTFTGNGMLQDATLNGTTIVNGTINGTTLDLDFSNGSVIFSDQNGILREDNNNFFWDRQNNRLGVGRNDPNELLTVNGTISMLNLSSAPTATAGFGKLFSNGNILYYRNGNGAITNLLAAASGGDATTLDTIDSTQFLRSDATDSYTGANTLTIAAAATLDIDGTLDIDSTAVSIADTDITFDGASTTFTQSTGAITLLAANGSNLNFRLDGLSDFVIDTDKFIVDNNGNIGLSYTPTNERLTINGNVSIKEGAAPSNSAGFGKLYINSANSKLYFLDDGGTSYNVTNGAASSPAEWGETGGALHPADNSAEQDILIGGTTAGAADIILDNGGAVIFNEQSNSKDFRVEGDNDINLIFADGSSDRVGIGVGAASIDYKLEVNGGVLAQTFNGSFIGNGKQLTGVAMSNGGTVVNQTINNSTINNADIYNSTLHNTTVNGLVTFTGNGMLQDATLNGTSTVSGNINVSGSINGTTLDLDFSNGSIIFSDQNGILREDNNNFFWDRQNIRLGIGRNDPNELLTINGAISMLNLNSAPNATVGFGKLFSNGNILYYRNGNGAITNLLAGTPNADTLDTLDSTDFLRSNATDSYTGANTLTIALAATLDIDGTLDIDSTAVSIADTDITLDGASTTFTQTTGAITLTPNAGSNLNVSLSGAGDFIVNTNDLVVDSSAGLIGINEVAPDAMLEISTLTTTEEGLHIKASSGQSADLLKVTDNSDNDWVTIGVNGATVFNEDSKVADFRIESDSSAGAFFLHGSNGYVGIDNLNPNEKLTVNGSLSLLNLSSAPAATSGFGKLFVNGDILYFRNGNGAITNLLAGGGGGGDATTLDSLDSTQFLRSDTSDSYTGANTLTIAAAATLDIDGTLDIDSTAVSIADTDITLDGASTTFTQTTGDISFNPGNGGDLKVTLLGTGDLEVDVNKFVIENNGNVGIGTGTGSIDAKLEVNGTILGALFNGTFIGNGAALTGVAGSINELSDGKTNSTSVFLGDSAGKNNTGARTVGLGIQALNGTSSSNDNIAIGWQALFTSTGTAESVAIGSMALQDTTTGGQNVAIGYRSLKANTTGNQNTAIGQRSLEGNKRGYENVGVGLFALSNNVNGNLNTAIGPEALNLNTEGDSNTAIGKSALSSNIDNHYNTGLGARAGLLSNGTGSTFVGYEAGSNLRRGSYNIIIGSFVDGISVNGSYQLNIGDTIYGSLTTDNIGISNSSPNERLTVNGAISMLNLSSAPSASSGFGKLFSNGNILYYRNGNGAITNLLAGGGGASAINDLTDGLTRFSGHQVYLGTEAGQNGDASIDATALGYRALKANNSGDYNTAIGFSALTTMNGSSYNTAVGYNALSRFTGGAGSNTAIGSLSQNGTSTGDHNTSLGRESLRSNSTGRWNTALGSHALNDNQTGNSNTAVGYMALEKNTSTENTAVGAQSLNSNTTGLRNTALGYYSLRSNTTGRNNVAVGDNALPQNKSGWGNVALGKDSMNVANGDYNIAIGFESLFMLDEGNENTVIGYNSLYRNQQGQYNTALGADSGHYTNGDYNTYMGHNAGFNIREGDYNIIIGAAAGVPFDNNGDYQLNIGNTLYGDLSTDQISIGTTDNFATLTTNGAFAIRELSSAPAASSNYGKIFDNGGTLYYRNGNGAITNLLSGGGGGSSEWTDTGSILHPSDGSGEEDIVIGGTTAGGADIILDNGGAAIFNEQGNSKDFRVEGDTATNLLLVDGSTDRVGINDPSPGTTLEVNGSMSYTGSAITNITAGGGLTVTKTIMKIKGSGGAVDITANPQIAAGSDGQLVIIKGENDTDTVKFDDGTGLNLTDGASFTMGNGDILNLIYDAGDSEWIEINRSNK